VLSKQRQANGGRLEAHGKRENDCSRVVGGISMCHPPYIGRGRPLRLPCPNSCDCPRNRPTSQDSTVMSARVRWPQSKRNQSARDTSQGQWLDPSGPGEITPPPRPPLVETEMNFEITIRSISPWPQKGGNYWDQGSLSKWRPKQLRAGNCLNIFLESCKERKQSLRLGPMTKQRP
jgi:hypothetical protein